MDNQSEVFIYPSSDPHTAVPDWVALHPGLADEERNLLHLILIGMKCPIPPTQEELAQQSRVHSRTVARRLTILAQRGFIETYRAGRRTFYRLQATTYDTMRISDPHGITDPHGVIYQGGGCQVFLGQQDAPNGHIFEKTISDRSVGVVVGDHDSEEDPTTNNGTSLKTRLARWLKQAGMNAARQFDDESLDYDTYVRFVKEKRGLGWEWRHIVSTLREAPLEPEPPAAPLDSADEPASAGELASAGDELASAGDDLATIEAARRAFRESCRNELLASANRRPPSYHGGKQ